VSDVVAGDPPQANTSDKGDSKMTSINRAMWVRVAVAAMAAALLFALTIASPPAHAASVDRTTYVTAGDFRTLATLWNTTATGTFRCPAGAQIRVRYGYGWFSKNRQQQTLDCQTEKRLSVGAWSLLVARLQIKVPTSGYVNWTYSVASP